MTALNKLYDLIYQPPTKVLIYGPHLSSVSESVAEVAGRWALVEVSKGTNGYQSLGAYWISGSC